jgi:hypothetical protein
VTPAPYYCRSFQEEAHKVWHDMSDATKLNIARGEETTTEHLLLRLASKHHGQGLTIKTFTKALERDNGADWGFWFADRRNRGLAVRVQAKRLYAKSGRYEQLYHPYKGPSKSGQTWANQCEAMLGWPDGAVPLYVFYNSDKLNLTAALSSMLNGWKDLRGLPFPLRDWGISAASALAIRKANWGKNDRPGNFPMLPWHCLVCARCWGKRSVGPTLPERIGHGLRQLYAYRAADQVDEPADPLELDFSFEPTSNAPEWAGLLREGSGAENLLNEQMSRLNLKGVAILQETEAER